MSRWARALPLSLALLLAAAAPPAKPRGHPDAGPNPSADACETCHRQATPEVFREWEGGPHGLVLVKCFVCHGSTGKDFSAAPDARRCQGCHPAEAVAVAARPGTGAPAQSGCFSCHAPHTLAAAGRPNPHAQ